MLSCVADKDRNHVKAFVLDQYPGFEVEAQKIITAKYGTAIFAEQEWGWRIEPLPKRNQWRVQYGCFRKITKFEEFLGGFLKEFSSELTSGLFSYNPKAKDKGIYIELLVDTNLKTIALSS
jgi:hypothetical protein